MPGTVVNTIYNPVIASHCVPKDDAITMLTVWSFFHQAQGLEEKRMIGTPSLGSY